MPILRWTGGKRWIIPWFKSILMEYTPEQYFEPFFGGGAVYFAFDWPKPTIADLNVDLMSAYRGILRDPALVRNKLSQLNVDPDTYMSVRQWKPRRDEYRAARLLYLNRLAYGGIYRTDRKGNFNVPYSGDRSTKTLIASTKLEEISTALAGANILASDFETVLEEAGPRSLVYCDPAYSLPGAERAFRRYSSPVFTWKDQVRLASKVMDLAESGSVVVLSNAVDQEIRDLYPSSLAVTIHRQHSLPNSRRPSIQEGLYIVGPTVLQHLIVGRLRSVTLGA